MEVGILAIFQNYGRQVDDAVMVRNELRQIGMNFPCQLRCCKG